MPATAQERNMNKKDLKTKYYIIKDGRVIGRVWGLDVAYKVCFLQKAAFACIYQHLMELNDEWLYQLYLEHVGDLPDPPMVVDQMARELFEALEAKKFDYIAKPSCRELLREMYTIRNHWHRQDITALCTGAKWSTIRVAMNQLKHEGFEIRYAQDGIYVRN